MWEGNAAQALFADAAGLPASGPPTCPYHPTFLTRSSPADDLAVPEAGEHSKLFFLGVVHQLEVVKDGTVDEVTPITFAICSAPRSPHTLWHLVNTAPAWYRVK